MPPGSPCGLVVDWVRSCRKGTWRFYPQDTGLLTRGRHYFLRDDAPHLSVPHLFGECCWRGGDMYRVSQLGMDPDLPIQWSNGFRNIFPPPVPVEPGTFSGMPLEWPEDRESVDGVDSRCWTNVNAPYVGPEEICALDSCCLQLAMIKLIDLVYEGNAAVVAAFFRAWIGPQCTTFSLEVAGNMPAICIAVHPNLTVAIVSGTSNFQQLALQGLYARNGPTDFGNYSTNDLWDAAATYLAEAFVASGVNPEAPLLLAGHSYGAALSAILAARIKNAFPERDVCWMGFGCPKPGDKRLRAMLNRVRTLPMVNDDDIVPRVPPNGIEVVALQFMIPVLMLTGWNKWREWPTYLQLQFNGDKQWVNPPLFDITILQPIVMNAVMNVPLRPIFGHNTTEYIRRLQLQCDGPCWPITPEAWRVLWDAPQLGRLGLGPPPFGRQGIGIAPLELPVARVAFLVEQMTTAIGFNPFLDLAEGAIALTAKLRVGEIGLGAPEAAAAELGTGAPEAAAAELGTGAPEAAAAELGTGAPEGAAAELGTGAPEIAEGEIGTNAPEGGEGEIGLVSPP